MKGWFVQQYDDLDKQQITVIGLAMWSVITINFYFSYVNRVSPKFTANQHVLCHVIDYGLYCVLGCTLFNCFEVITYPWLMYRGNKSHHSLSMLNTIGCERLFPHSQTSASIQSVDFHNYCKIDVYQVKWPYGPIASQQASYIF